MTTYAKVFGKSDVDAVLILEIANNFQSQAMSPIDAVIVCCEEMQKCMDDHLEKSDDVRAEFMPVLKELIRRASQELCGRGAYE